MTTSTRTKRAKKTRGQTRSRVQRHRHKLRESGLKPAQLWVWDRANPELQSRIDRDCQIINAQEDSRRVLAEIEAWTDFESWGPAPDFVERK